MQHERVTISRLEVDDACTRVFLSNGSELVGLNFVASHHEVLAIPTVEITAYIMKSKDEDAAA